MDTAPATVRHKTENVGIITAYNRIPHSFPFVVEL